MDISEIKNHVDNVSLVETSPFTVFAKEAEWGVN